MVQTAWLGDALLSTPLLRALGGRYGMVDVVTTPAAVPLFETHPVVRTVLPFDKHGGDRGIGGLARTARRLRARAYRRAYLAQGSWRSALLVRLAGIPDRIGFVRAAGQLLYTDTVTPSGSHQADRLRSLLCADEGDSELTLALTDSDLAAARAALREAGVAAPFVVLAPGSAQPTKRWPHFAKLARELGAHCSVVVVGSAADINAATPWPLCPGAADLRGRLALRESAAVIALAAAAVTNDSAPLHMAQAVGTPVVALFGPTAAEAGFGPRGARDAALGLTLPCRPCSTHGGRRCPLEHHRCMIDLSVAAVRHAVVSVLGPESAACA